MKKLNHIFLKTAIIFSIALGMLSACKNEENLELPYLFRPINFAVELNKTVATLSWAAVDSAKSYTLQISEDSLFNTVLIDTTLDVQTFTKELGGETKYFAQVRANASDETMNSKFNSKLSFKTPKENIFTGFGTSNNTGTIYSAYMTGFNTLTVKWQPGANVTHLILTSADQSVKDSVPLSSSEMASGVAIVPSLVNSKWKVQIYNNTFLRGTTSGIVEGDVLLNAGDDLQTALNNATEGQIIVLAGNSIFNVGSTTYRFSKSVKLRGASPSQRPVVCLTAGTGTPPSTTSSTLGFLDGSTIQSVKFENIDFTGYVDNSTSSTKIGYLFNNNTMTTVSKLSFTNCNMHNFGNTPMRLQGGKNQVIDSLSMNGCVINDIGFSSTYAVVNTNSADFINAIEITNSTIYNFKGSLILRTGQTLKSVKVTNCTIDQGMQDPGSSRYLMDFNTASFTSEGVTIQNCIFGLTGNVKGANGIRYVAGTTYSNIGSYYTSDYVDDPIPAGTTSSSIKSSMTAYSGASTSLWKNSLNGDFGFSNSSFAGAKTAGDPRWR